MEIQVLIDDRRINKNFHKEHGLSIHINFQGKNILFDTGASARFIKNAEKLNINIADVDMVVISHAHADHSGGVVDFLRLNNKASVYMSRTTVNDYYVKFLCLKKSVSPPQILFDEFIERIIFIDDYEQLSEQIFIAADFLKPYPLARSNKNLWAKKNGQMMHDNFEHELVLVLNDCDKLVVINGCCHNGVENIIETVNGLFPLNPVKVLIGGLHLMDFPRNYIQESQQHIQAMGRRLIEYDLEKVYTCHCTGKRAFGFLKNVMESRIDYLSAGMRVSL